ncbi:hypothetical protein TVAG_444960 [Trichomonas vaginalis G3]|uniref:Uncharacterized protein n=1 Tax=Trichomonas vaginalis (strain ATCC PRA-98 / G3) TaxID=412133 RepID=A2FZT6_TRIV3|nr:hypothetical protein TVAG_444960 [Trichomonas vaginalis G3]|eukprot:XP_001302507.1 hypothetical protein [Trichomonas vaginalis G3]
MQVYYINETDRFSVIGYIDDNFKINGLYNFLFHFPDDYPDDFFYFNQSTHPLTSTTVQNFHYIFDNKKCFPNPNLVSILNGLAKSSESGAVLDGNVEFDQWWYSIGTNSYYLKQGKIPGPCCANLQDSVTHTNDLYIKIIDESILRFLPPFHEPLCLSNVLKYQNRCYFHLNFFEIFIGLISE